MKTKFGKIITAVLMLCLAFAVCMAMTACNKTVDKLTSELGVVIEGEFDKGAQLVTEPIEVTGEKGKNVIALLEEKEYAKEGEVRIFDISVVKDGSKVQPSGKVKVTVPAPFESESGYVTFHIKDDNSVEELKTTYADGKISFETDSFSYFVVTEALFNTPPADVTSLKLDAANAGFTEGKATYVIGDEFPPKPENVVVYGVTATGEKYLEKTEYTVDLGGLDFEKEGTYTITYTYKKDTSVKATLTVEVVKPKFAFQAIVGEGVGLIHYGGEEMPNGYYGEHKAGEQIALKAVADSGYEFVGWYTYGEGSEFIPELISDTAEYTFTAENRETTVQAVFAPVVTSLRLDGANAGFTDGKATYVIGNEFPPKPENVVVCGVTAEDEYYLEKHQYTVDLGGLDFTKEGTYTITYTYKKDTSIKATLSVEVVKPKFAFQAIVGEGKGSILYGGEEMPNGYYGEHKAGEQIALKAVADSGYEFVGWYTDANEPQLISANAEHTFTTGNAPQTVKAVFNAVVTSLKLDAANAGFTDGKATYVIGSENKPNPENVVVYGVTIEGEEYLEKIEYAVDLGGLDFEKEGMYTITYTYKKDTSVKATLTVTVVNAGEINLSLSGSSSRSAYYTGGCAPRIAKSEILNNGEPCDLDALGLSWEWRDLSGAVVNAVYDTTWDDETLFPTPAKAGTYKFVIYSETDGVKTDLLVTEHEIIERKMSLVTDSSIGTYEYYVPIAKVTIDGTTKYYAMPMPGSLSSNMSKLPAIEVTPDENGNFMIGGKGEFAFFLDWLSGGYNACIGGDYANGQGALYLSSSGVIAFDPTYNAKDFAVTFSLNEDGSISFKCPHEGGTLSFAYTEADGYYFTASKTDEATYYPVYLYQTYVAPPTEQYEYIGGDLSKTYDGEAVSVDPYKDFVIRTENGEDWSVLSKNGTGRFAWGTGKGEDLQAMTDDGSGRLTGPSEVGDYCIVFQIQLKDGTWQTAGYGPLVYFSIT